MTFKPAVWFPISAVLSVINVVAAGFAAAGAEPVHAGTHAALAVAFGLWAQHLRQAPRPVELQPSNDTLEAIEAEMSRMREELTEMQERLDFAERVLAKPPELRREDPQR